jgi:hypothetical protein
MAYEMSPRKDGMIQRDDGTWIWPAKITVARVDPAEPLEPPETCPLARTVVAAFRDAQGGTLVTRFNKNHFNSVLEAAANGWTMLGWQDLPEEPRQRSG